MKILILRFSALGDVALVRPVLESLLAQNREISAVLCTRKAFIPLFEGIDRLDFFEFEPSQHSGLPGLYRLSTALASMGFDRVLDLHGVLRSQVLCRFLRLKGLRCFSIDKERALRKKFLNSEPGERPKLKHATERYRDVFSKAGISTPDPKLASPKARIDDTAPIGFAPCASTPEKTWIEEHSIALIEQMLNLGYTLRLFGSAEELKQLRTRLPEHKKLEWSDPRLGLGAEWRSMDELRGMIAMDSANLHLASLRGLQTLSVWGSTHPDAGFAPVGANHRFVQIDESQLDCRPCSIFGNVSCARHDRACLLWIKPESVLAEVVDLWPLNQPSSTEPAQAPSSKARP